MPQVHVIGEAQTTSNDLESLAGLVRDHLVRIGGCSADVDLTIPMLLQLLDDSAAEFERMQKALSKDAAPQLTPVPSGTQQSILESKCRDRLIRWLVEDALATNDRAAMAGFLRKGLPGFETMTSQQLIEIAKDTGVPDRDGFQELAAVLAGIH